MKAVWNDTIIAESTDTIVVENNHYFPLEAVNKDYLKATDAHTICPWKGQASYYSIVVDGQENKDAGWYYPDPKPAAANIKNRVAFWKGVKVIE